jgi:hypothetical protein
VPVIAGRATVASGNWLSATRRSAFMPSAIRCPAHLGFEVAAVKTSKKGNKFLSLSIKPKDERQSAGGGPRKRDVDDEIPF